MPRQYLLNDRQRAVLKTIRENTRYTDAQWWASGYTKIPTRIYLSKEGAAARYYVGFDDPRTCENPQLRISVYTRNAKKRAAIACGIKDAVKAEDVIGGIVTRAAEVAPGTEIMCSADGEPIKREHILSDTERSFVAELQAAGFAHARWTSQRRVYLTPPKREGSANERYTLSISFPSVKSFAGGKLVMTARVENALLIPRTSAGKEYASAPKLVASLLKRYASMKRRPPLAGA